MESFLKFRSLAERQQAEIIIKDAYADGTLIAGAWVDEKTFGKCPVTVLSQGLYPEESELEQELSKARIFAGSLMGTASVCMGAFVSMVDTLTPRSTPGGPDSTFCEPATLTKEALNFVVEQIQNAEVGS